MAYHVRYNGKYAFRRKIELRDIIPNFWEWKWERAGVRFQENDEGGFDECLCTFLTVVNHFDS